MNLRNMENLIESIKGSRTFNMAMIFNNSKSPGSILGHAANLNGYVPNYNKGTFNCYLDTIESAKTYLEIKKDQIDKIEDPWLTDFRFKYIDDRKSSFPYTNLDKIKKEEAVTMLQNFIDTGEIRWQKL